MAYFSGLPARFSDLTDIQIEEYIDRLQPDTEENSQSYCSSISTSSSQIISDELNRPESLLSETPLLKKTVSNAAVLSKFCTVKNKNPKKEYVRVKLIRGHKRANRQIASGVHPVKTINRFDKNNQNSRRYWKLMMEVYYNNQELFDEQSTTESGPATDGKAKKRNRNVSQPSKSFNNSYVASYLDNPFTKESFHYYVELIFSDPDPQLLCEKFEFLCCKNPLHSEECRIAWNDLKDWIQREMFYELKIMPFQTPTEPMMIETLSENSRLEMEEIETEVMMEDNIQEYF